MIMHQYEHNSDFNPGVIRDLLRSITVSPETGARLGVPTFRLEQWIHELAERLDGEHHLAGAGQGSVQQTPSYKGSKLSAGEINFLLDGFDAVHALEG